MQDVSEVRAQCPRKLGVVDLEVLLILETQTLEGTHSAQEDLEGSRRRLVDRLGLLHILRSTLVLIDEEEYEGNEDRHVGDPARPDDHEDIPQRVGLVPRILDRLEAIGMLEVNLG